jgi:6-hydroxycyclohex-1-ene-1-carbonyl-CoA dehydrogenase
MAFIPDTIATWRMVQPETRDRATGETIPGRFELVEIPVPALAAGEVLVEIAGCGVCASDLGFFYDAVPTGGRPPLTLGHEISGTVVAGETSWLGKEVLITGTGSGIHGGFSSHIAVAAASLCAITNRRTIPLEHLAAVADTVATAFQAARRAAIAVRDNVLVIGAAEMGPFVVQMAKAFGAAAVMVVDTVAARRDRVLTCGADAVIIAADTTPAEVAAEVKHLRETQGLPACGWKIFETTGTSSGRETALALVGQGEKLILAASEPDTVEHALSSFPALDAEIIGSGRCPPDDYPRVLDMVTSGVIVLAPFVQTRPMSWIREAFAEARTTPPDRHTVLTADDVGLEVCPEPKSCR